MGRLDPADRLLLGDDALVDHVGGDLHGGGRGPLGGPRLEHVQAAALDRELEVLDVAVVAARAAGRCAGTRRRPRACRSAIWAIFGAVRMPATTSSPWALVRYSPKSTFSPVFGSRVNATPVPESSPMLPKTIVTTLTAVPRSSGDLLVLAVVAGALAEPAREDRLDREVELLVRVARGSRGRCPRWTIALNSLDEVAQGGGVEVGVLRRRRAPPSTASSAWSKRSPVTSITIRPNIWMKRR